MATIKAIAPQLLVADLPRAQAFYVDALGFSEGFTYEGFYSGMARDGAVLHLKCAPFDAAERARFAAADHLHAFLEVDDAEALWAEFDARGAAHLGPLQEHPWRTRDFIVTDPDGNVLCFSEDLS